jgi:RNA polymerase primary sigma factor
MICNTKIITNMKQFKIQKTLTDRSEISIEKYFNDVNRQREITQEEEVLLSERIKEGDKEALDILVTANLKFAISVAKKYQNMGLELSDLINEANIGLIKAAERFDATRGFKFISYAVWWIRQTVLQSISEKKRMIKIPSNKNMLAGKYFNAMSNLTQELERNPTILELSEYMKISDKEAKSLQEILFKHESLDKKVSSDDSSSLLVDILPDNSTKKTEGFLIDESLTYDINRALSILSHKEIYIIKSLYGIGCNLKSKEEIAEELEFSTERIRQISKGAEKKLSKNESARNLLIKYL